jgi:hypothetical protein
MSTNYSTEYGWLLITTGVLLVVVGAAMLGASGPRHGRRRTRIASSRARRLSSALVCAAAAGGVITGVQWAVLSQTDPAAWVAVLGPPALLAGATVTRLLLLVVGVAGCRRRRARYLPHERISR